MIRDLINRHMWDNNIKKVQLQELSGVPYSMICKYLNNKGEVHTNTVEKLIEGLSLKIELK